MVHAAPFIQMQPVSTDTPRESLAWAQKILAVCEGINALPWSTGDWWVDGPSIYRTLCT